MFDSNEMLYVVFYSWKNIARVGLSSSSSPPAMRTFRCDFKGALYRICCGVNILGDRGMKVV